MGHSTLSKSVKGALTSSQIKDKIREFSDNDRSEFGTQEGSWFGVSYNDMSFVDTTNIYNPDEAEEIENKYAHNYGGCVFYVLVPNKKSEPLLKTKEATSYVNKRKILEEKVANILKISPLEDRLSRNNLKEGAKSFICSECKSKINYSKYSSSIDIRENRKDSTPSSLFYQDTHVDSYVREASKEPVKVNYSFKLGLIITDFKNISITCPCCQARQEDVGKIFPKLEKDLENVKKYLECIEELDLNLLKLIGERYKLINGVKGRRLSSLSAKELELVRTYFAIDVHH